MNAGSWLLSRERQQEGIRHATHHRECDRYADTNENKKQKKSLAGICIGLASDFRVLDYNAVK
jgi:hypothetical protein